METADYKRTSFRFDVIQLPVESKSLEVPEYACLQYLWISNNGEQRVFPVSSFLTSQKKQKNRKQAPIYSR